MKEQFNIGSREVCIQALKDGSNDLVPEHPVALQSYVDPTSTAATGINLRRREEVARQRRHQRTIRSTR